jgi:hypothetical protein
VPALVVVGLVLAFVPNVLLQARAANYADTDAAMHRSYVDGSLPLGLRSSSSELVTAWFTDKVPFSFRLPNARSALDCIPAYRLTGLGELPGKFGCLRNLRQAERENQPSGPVQQDAFVAGGDKVRVGALTFDYRTDQNFKVITWSNRGLSYALVSSVSGSARESCRLSSSMPNHHDLKPSP